MTAAIPYLVRQGAARWALAFGLLLALAFVSPASAESPSETAGPVLFGMETEPLVGAMVAEKWNRARTEIARELDVVARCHGDDACPTDARKLIDLSATGAGQNDRAKIGLINRAVDLAIKPVSDDAQWGVADRWSAPFETLRSSRGDCEDYAFLKYLALLEAGISRNDLKIVILKNAFPREDHAVVAVRVDAQWLLLDNRTLTLVRDVDLMRATPEYVLDQAGVRRFVTRGRASPVGIRMARSG